MDSQEVEAELENEVSTSNQPAVAMETHIKTSLAFKIGEIYGDDRKANCTVTVL